MGSKMVSTQNQKQNTYIELVDGQIEFVRPVGEVELLIRDQNAQWTISDRIKEIIIVYDKRRTSQTNSTQTKTYSSKQNYTSKKPYTNSYNKNRNSVHKTTIKTPADSQKQTVAGKSQDEAKKTKPVDSNGENESRKA